MHPRLKFQQKVEVQPLEPPAHPPDDVAASIVQSVINEFRGVFFQGGEIELGNPVRWDEAAQQVADHLGVGEESFVAVIVVSHLLFSQCLSAFEFFIRGCMACRRRSTFPPPLRLAPRQTRGSQSDRAG